MKNHRYGNFTVKKTSPALKRMRMKIKAQKKQIKSNRRGVFVIGKTDTSVSEVHQKLPKLVFLHSSHGVAAYQMLLTISSCCGSDFPSWMLCSCKKCSASSAAIQPRKIAPSVQNPPGTRSPSLYLPVWRVSLLELQHMMMGIHLPPHWHSEEAGENKI